MSESKVTYELQGRYSHWRRLELEAANTYGMEDDLTTLYRSKREAAEQAADALQITVSHLMQEATR